VKNSKIISRKMWEKNYFEFLETFSRRTQSTVYLLSAAVNFHKTSFIFSRVFDKLFFTSHSLILLYKLRHRQIAVPGPPHNGCKTVWLSEALLVYGDMTWLLRLTVWTNWENCLKSAFLLSRTPRAAGQYLILPNQFRLSWVTLGYDAN
jgi:hypothetical protein